MYCIQQAAGNPAGYHSDTVPCLVQYPIVMLITKCHPCMNLGLETKGTWIFSHFHSIYIFIYETALFRSWLKFYYKWFQIAKWMQHIVLLFVLSGWLPDQDTGARVGTWLYLPGPESWSSAAQPHWQLLQAGAHRVCPRSHGEGKLHTRLQRL